MEIGLNMLIFYLAGINLYTYTLYGVDKRKAKAGQWRISERHLLLAAFAGGSFGAFMGMKTFRHKTKHAVFQVGVPVMMLLHAALLTYALSQGWFV